MIEESDHRCCCCFCELLEGVFLFVPPSCAVVCDFVLRNEFTHYCTSLLATGLAMRVRAPKAPSKAAKAAPPKAPESATAPAPLVLSSRLANANRAPLNLRPMPKITRQEVNGQRFYKVDGFNELLPSVTTVLGTPPPSESRCSLSSKILLGSRACMHGSASSLHPR